MKRNDNKKISLYFIIYVLICCSYIVPFYYLIGEQGGALFGYAYCIYIVFLSLFSFIPQIICEVTSEYLDSDDYHNRVFKICKSFSSIVGIVIFLFLFIFADAIASLIIGDTIGGNSINDIVLVIRFMSLSFLIIPSMYSYRGYLKEYKINKPISISKIIEQLVVIFVIIIGSFIGVKVLHLSLSYTISIAISSLVFGTLFSYLYLRLVTYTNKNKLSSKTRTKKIKVSNKDILKKILYCSLPLVLIAIFKVLFNLVDVFTIVKALINNIGYTKESSESIISIITVWGFVLNEIIIVLIVKNIFNLVPNIKNSSELNKKVNKILQIAIYVTLPIVFMMSIISRNIWNVLYGISEYGSSIYSYYVFVIIVLVFFTISVDIVNKLKNRKIIYISIISGTIIKICLNTPLLYGFNKMGLPAYYGPVTATILGYGISTIICIIFLNIKYKIDYEETIKIFIDVLNATLVMTIVLLLIKLYIPINSTSRLINLFVILIYIIVGGILYIAVTFGNRSFHKIFGNILKKGKRK